MSAPKGAKKPKLEEAPAPLTELCHDALARGTLALHDGLPPTWLKMFQSHPKAWEQLQDAVVKSMGRKEEWLTEDSTVMIFYEDRNCTSLPNRCRTFLVPATELPRWLYVLLQGFFQALYFKHPDSHGVYPNKDGMGAYEVNMQVDRAAEKYFLKICSICDHAKGALSELYNSVVLRLVREFEIRLSGLFSDRLYWWDPHGERHEYEQYKGMCTEELMGEFPEVVREALCTKISDAEIWDLDVKWADELWESQLAANADASLNRAPFATLYFSFPA